VHSCLVHLKPYLYTRPSLTSFLLFLCIHCHAPAYPPHCLPPHCLLCTLSLPSPPYPSTLPSRWDVLGDGRRRGRVGPSWQTLPSAACHFCVSMHCATHLPPFSLACRLCLWAPSPTCHYHIYLVLHSYLQLKLFLVRVAGAIASRNLLTPSCTCPLPPPPLMQALLDLAGGTSCWTSLPSAENAVALLVRCGTLNMVLHLAADARGAHCRATPPTTARQKGSGRGRKGAPAWTKAGRTVHPILPSACSKKAALSCSSLPVPHSLLILLVPAQTWSQYHVFT